MVRFQVALTPARRPASPARRRPGDRSRRDAGDRWTRTAVLSSLRGPARRVPRSRAGLARCFLRTPAGRESWPASWPRWSVRPGCPDRSGRSSARVLRRPGRPARPGVRWSSGWAVASGARGSPPGLLASGREMGLSPADREELGRRIFERAAREAEAGSGDRLEAIRVLAARAGRDGPSRSCLPCSTPASRPTSSSRRSRPWPTCPARGSAPLIVGLEGAEPARRSRGDRGPLRPARPRRRPARRARGRRRSAPAELDPARRKQLLAHPDPAIRARASRLLGADVRPDRGAVIARVPAGPGARGRPGPGPGRRSIRLRHLPPGRGPGGGVGPDLATVAGRTPEDLLVHILDPNREVPPNYLNYTVATTDGRVLTGLIAEESAGAVTLKRAGGVDRRRPPGRDRGDRLDRRLADARGAGEGADAPGPRRPDRLSPRPPIGEYGRRGTTTGHPAGPPVASRARALASGGGAMTLRRSPRRS